MSSHVRLGRIDHGVEAEGPGKRTVVWFQGCSIRCIGCINPHLFSRKGGTSVSPEAIVNGATEHGDEGLTLIGGEPFDQPEALKNLATAAQRAGLGVICFTGYRFDDLRLRGEPFSEALQSIDLLVDGPFEQDNPENSRALVGSNNQRFISLTSRYKNFDPETHPNKVELRVSKTGGILLSGFLNSDKLAEFSELGELKIARKRK